MMRAEIIPVGTALFITGFVGMLLNWLWRGLKWAWLTPKKQEKYLRQQGFSGNPYRLLVGDLKDSNKMEQEAHSKPINLGDDICPRLMPYEHHTIQTYGKKCFTWLGPYPNVIVMDPEALREIVTKHDAWPKPLDMLSHVPDIVTGLVKVEGEEWSKRRRFLDPLFRIDSLKNMLPEMYLSCKEMLKEWETLALPNGSKELDSWPYCHTLSTQLLAQAVFGSSYKEGMEIFQVQQELFALGHQALHSVYIPGYNYLPTKFNRRLRECKKETQRGFKEMIEKKAKEIASSGDQTNNDIISSMLISNSKIIKEQGEEAGITINDIIDLCEQFYDAGEAGVSSLFVWSLVMLSQHQEWQQKARDEILQVFGHNEPDLDGLNRLKIVTMFLTEVLRLYSPAFRTMRGTKKEMKLEKYSLPAGVLITIPPILVHYDKDLWGNDVKEFKPERFAEGVATATKGRFCFMPFMTGGRSCIGYNLTMVQTKLLVCTILQRFSLQLSPDYTHTPFPVRTTFPQHGARIIIRTL